MKNIAIALVGSLIALFLLQAIGLGWFLMTVVMPFIPILIYAKLTTYKTKPFIIAWIVGLVASGLVYFVLQLIAVMFGFGETATTNMAYVSAIVGFLISVLVYRKINK